MIKFNKHYVTNGTDKARVIYLTDNRADGRKCVTIYAKDYSRKLGAVFGAEYQNDTDSMTDYFDEGRVVLFEEHPLYSMARERVESLR
jgi:cell fate regulator YaaT (PSP1 superfamily)